MKPVRFLASSIRLLLPLCLAATAIQAANSRWTGSAGDGDWTNPANWTAGVPGLASPGTTSTDTAGFDTSATTTVTVDAGRNLFGLKFDNSISTDGTGASSFTINGGPLVISTASLPTIEVAGMIGHRTQTVNAGITITKAANSNDLLVTTSHGFDGTLLFTGAIAPSASSGTSQMTLRPGTGGLISFVGPISNGAGTNVLKFELANSSGGTVSLSGTNSFTGGIFVDGGTLILDHSTNSAIVASNQGLSIGGGTLIVRGNSTGTTALTLDGGAGSALSTQSTTSGTLVVDNNGGGGTTLTLGNTWTRAGGSSMLFDLSSGGTIVSSPTMTNGVVTAASTAAAFFVKDATGTGFATVANGKVVRYTGASTLTGTGNATMNLKTSGGTLSGTTEFFTMEFDASNAADSRILDLGAFNLHPNNGGATMLVSGNNDFTITGTTGAINNNSVLYHAGSGTLDVEANISGGFTKAGPGFMIFGRNATANFTMEGGVTRFTGPDATIGGNIAISSGAVMEIGTDMNGAGTFGDFSRPLGTGTTGFQIVGSGGFSASGADRMVNVGGASAQVNWGSTAGSNLLNGVFILSSDHADATLEFQNPIGLAGVDRTIQVNNGSADIDARLSGAISSSSATGINKTGAGTLELSGVNTYAGNTRVDGGRLLLTGPLLSTNALIIANGASVQLNMDERINNSALVRLEGGSLLTSGLFETVGKLEISGNSVIDLGNGFGAIVTFADSSSSAWSGTLSILNWSGTPEVGGGTDQLYFGFNSAGLTPSQLAGIQFVNPEGLPGGIYGAVMLDSGEVVVVPEPGVWVMIASGLGLLAGVQRVRRRG